MSHDETPRSINKSGCGASSPSNRKRAIIDLYRIAYIAFCQDLHIFTVASSQ